MGAEPGVKVCFTTDVPVEEVAAHLRSLGIVVEAGPVAKVGARARLRSIYFRDPDGSLIEVANEVA